MTASLVERIPETPDPDELLDAFLGWTTDTGIDLYPAQEEAILEVLAGANVVLNTPTGSGKSLVALAAHFRALARGERSWYTAPIKALVSEKFFDLTRTLGADHVGMLTGDASVNAGAPVVCCTAEVLANLALREGADAPVDQVCADEFHYYAEPDRGWAWQVPLLELTRSRFLLMSATLGDTSFFTDELARRTGRPTALVHSTERPVPLDYEYRDTPVHETVEELLAGDRAPVYIVHFTQKAATERAQALTSIDVLDQAGKDALREAIGGFRFEAGFGRDLSRFVRSGVGVHHAGMLPKYRLLVEKLAQQGLLRVVCGTDTLGVGVNVPIRTVLFTQLHKYDGRSDRLLSNREFQQIAGRAGRAGFDTRGSVWVQAPEYVVENRRIDDKIAADPARAKKLRKKKPPDRGFVHWDETTMARMAEGAPETLTSSFEVSHGMLMHLLDRPGDGCGATRHLLTTNHEPRADQRRHIRRAIAIYRSLVEAEVVEVLDRTDELGRRVRVAGDLQADFQLNQPLSPFVIDAVELLDRASPTYALDVLSLVEAVLDNPMVVLMAQLDRAKTELINQLKADGFEYEERMDRLDEVEWPKPLRDWTYGVFNAWEARHPWVGQENIKPKAVAREMAERAMTFRDYIGFHGLKRSEGVVLRYLTEAYKAMVQTVPDSARTDEVDDLTEWLGTLVRQVDSSLLEEWERLRDPEAAVAPVDDVAPPVVEDVTTNVRAFRVMVRNAAFRWVEMIGRRSGELPEAVRPAVEEYFAEHAEVRNDADARGPDLFSLDPANWTVAQTLLDPADHREWVAEGRVDVEASKEEGNAVLVLQRLRRR